ncbi:MAG: PEP-utilizing enzyme, partial [bacterium]|nr:PEP-utilizing enzyme [bacterium]
ELLANRDDATANIARRKAERTTFAQLNLPRVILASQLDSLPNALKSPTTADTGGQQHAWQGTALSPGRATGVAMVAEIATGQSPPAQPFVLVCPSTDPGWTPLMASAAALVVERGGLLSHGALIAREFGLPAVRLEEARSHIRSGATITVDGGEGTVTLSAH